ncbi:MAG: Type 1 glutamine amidotransferase-like domain-containing protein, partial [Chloroflexi bacterium]|nr:Type 1 glutamine amidotransferase-like domain-containing protein [Chloroflexota bacterium]
RGECSSQSEARMNGTLALVGAGEFLPAMEDCDRMLLDRSGERRVAILPTASAPDGEGVPQRWADQGVAHFERLGAQAVGVLALTRDDCNASSFVEMVAESSLVYFSGGKPDYLLRTLVDTPLWEAVLQVRQRGGVVAGCSARAMVMGAFVPNFGVRPRRIGWKGWLSGLGLVPDWAIMPHFDEIPELLVRVALRPPRAAHGLLGIDRDTALVGEDGTWRVCGRGRVSLVRGMRAQRYRENEWVPLG